MQNQEKRKYACEYGGTQHIQPNSVKPQIPECAKHENREYQCNADGKYGCRQGLFDGAEKALGCNGKPAEKVGEAEKPQCPGSESKEPCFLCIYEKRSHRSGKEKHDCRSDKAHHAGADEIAFGNFFDSVVVRGTPVETDGR